MELIKENFSLKNYSSWRVGGKADYFAEPQSLQELKDICAWAQKNQQPVSVIGGGSNILISDQGVAGLVICMRHLNRVKEEACQDFTKKNSSENSQVTEESPLLSNKNSTKESSDQSLHLICEAGAMKSQALKVFLKHQLPPALFLTGLPGDIGGGVVMNAGVGVDIVPKEFCEIVEWVEVLRPEGTVEKVETSDIQWDYRSSKGWQPGIIVRVGLVWPMKDKDEQIMQKMKQATRRRVQSQPLNLPSCGSTFRNPKNNKAGALIEACGLKGYRVGGAEISSKHANFLTTSKEATASDVDSLIKYIQKAVKIEKGIELQTEVVRLGRWSS